MSEALANRNSNIEWLKFVSTFFIVWFHSGYQYFHQFSYSGLIIFIIIALYFSVENHEVGGLKKLVKRLIVPWAFFTLVFGVGNSILAKPFINVEGGVIVGLLTGTHIHLWYLPFIFLMLCFSGVLAARLPRNILAIIMFVFFMTYIALTPYWRSWSLGVGAPVAQYVHAVGAVFLGVFIRSASALADNNKKIMYVCLYAGLFTTISDVGIGVPYLVALSVVILALHLKSNSYSSWAINNVFPATFGVFLIHPALLYLFKGHTGSVIYPIETFIVSLLIIMSLRKTFPKFMLKIT